MLGHFFYVLIFMFTSLIVVTELRNIDAMILNNNIIFTGLSDMRFSSVEM